MTSGLLTLHASPYGPDPFRVLSVEGRETLGRPYVFDLLLDGLSGNRQAECLVLAEATLTIQGPGPPMVRHGILGAVEEREDGEGRPALWVRLLPRLWTLSLDCRHRVFSGRSIPAILGALLEEARIPFRMEALPEEDWPALDHVCQYGESTLAFLERWCEHLGLVTCFAQEAGHEVVVLLEDPAGHPVLERPLPFQAPGESFRSFAPRYAPAPGGALVKGLNLDRPSLGPLAREGTDPSARSRLGERGDTSRQAARLARIRLQAQACRREVFRGEGCLPSLAPGLRFTLRDHPHGPRNRDYVVLSMEHRQGPAGVVQSLEAIPGDRPFRPPLQAPWPRIAGSLLARIDAPAEGPVLDERGRYRVELPYDLGDEGVAPAVAWVPLLRPFGGADGGFNGRLEPGMDVLLSFLQGDPDRPVISGALPTLEHPAAAGALDHEDLLIRTSRGDVLAMGGPETGALGFRTEGHLDQRSRTAHQVTTNHRTDITLGSETRILLGAGLDLRAGNQVKSEWGAIEQLNYAPTLAVDFGRHVHYGKGERTAFNHQGINLGYTWFAACLPRDGKARAVNLQVSAMAASLAMLQATALIWADRRAKVGHGWTAGKGESGAFLAGTLALSAGFGIFLQDRLQSLRVLRKTAVIQATTLEKDQGSVVLGVDELEVPEEIRVYRLDTQIMGPVHSEKAWSPLMRAVAGLVDGGRIPYLSRYAYGVEVTSAEGVVLSSRNAKLAGDTPKELERKGKRGELVDYCYSLDARGGHTMGTRPFLDSQEDFDRPRHVLSLSEPDGVEIAGLLPKDPRGLYSIARFQIRNAQATFMREDFQPCAYPVPPAPDYSTLIRETGFRLEENGDLLLGVAENPLLPGAARAAAPPPPKVTLANPEGGLELKAKVLTATTPTVAFRGCSAFSIQGQGFGIAGGQGNGGALRMDGTGTITIG